MTITLYCFRPAGGLPDGSPFVLKAMTLLKLAELDYVEDRSGFAKAPKGKQPYIDDGGKIVADSTFIRFHLEDAHGVDFDSHLTSEQKAFAWALEKMCEEHLYWIVVCARWLDDANFERGPARLFKRVPAFARPFVIWSVRRRIGKSAYAQGMARHTPEQRAELGRRDIDAIATLLGDKPFLFGDQPCGADATVFAFVATILAPSAEFSTRDDALAKPNLVAFRDRMLARCFPDFAREA